jgi:DNA-binding IscR family transcriptional regulator
MSLDNKYSDNKYGSKQTGTFSPLQKYHDSEPDPYSPVIVEDLLQGVNEWRNIQDIVRLTFKALTDVVKAQGETLRELERQMPTRASKAELNSGLSLKASISDITRTIAEVASSLETKLSFDDCQSILKDNYISKSDFQYLMSNKASIDEVRNLMDSKISASEFKLENNSLHQKWDDIYKDLNKKISNCVNSRDFQALTATVEIKANLAEMNEQLESKANKQSVANALHRKANRSDVESLLARKADMSDVQNILGALENKVDVATADKLSQLLDSKIDKNEFNMLISNIQGKSDKTDFDIISTEIHNLRLDNEHRFLEVDKRYDYVKNDVESTKHTLNSGLNKKVDAKEYDRLFSLIGKKADMDQVNSSLLKIKTDVNEEFMMIKNEVNLQKRAVEESLLERQHKSELFYEKLSDELYKVNDQMKNVLEERRGDIEETAKFVKGVTNTTKKEIQIITDKLSDDVDNLRKHMDDIMIKKLDKKEYSEWKAKVLAQIDGKVDLSEVQTALNACQSDIGRSFQEYKDEFKSLFRNQENEMFNLLSKKANLSEINAALTTKADTSLFNSIVGQKIGAPEFEELKRKIEYVLTTNEEKCNQRDFEHQVGSVKRNLEDVQKEILLKANIKDVCTLLDTKANIDDVNKALVEIHKELDGKSNGEDMTTMVNDQALINESLCTENIVGRWAWKSGELKTGSSVPWEIQLANTLPDNFLWEKEKTSILTVAPGLYEITFGFFAKKKPTVQLLVNGEPILSAVNTASYVIHHTSGKMKDVTLSKHPSGNITGLTMIDFIILPARARVSLAYTGEVGGEGFLGLKRL